MRWVVGVVVACVVALALFAVPANSAAPFQLSILGPTQVIAGGPMYAFGGSLTAAARGVPGQPVEVSIDGEQIATGTTDNNGVYSVSLSFDAPGDHVVNAIAFRDGSLETPSNDLAVEARLYRLGVARAGAGRGRVTSAPAGIDCGADCIEDIRPETDIVLTASAEAGSTFSGWSGACTGAAAACTIRMEGDRSTTATFVDTVAPDAPILQGTIPASPSRTANPHIYGRAEPGVTVRLFTDAACSTATAASGIASSVGTFAIQVLVPTNTTTTFWARATDAGANVSACSTTSIGFTHDNAPPDVPVLTHTSPTSPSATEQHPTVHGTTEGSASVQLYSNATCSTPIGDAGNATSTGAFAIAVGVPENSTTSFRARATDAAGNTSACSTSSVTYTHDAAGPNTVIDSAPPLASNSTSATFVFHATEPATGYACALDGGAFIACVPPASYTGLTEGAHSFAVRATDAAGNQDPTPATHAWRIDTTAPETTITGGPASNTSLTSAAFTFEADELAARFECALDAAAFTACTSPRSVAALTDGAHTFRARAIDAAGNTDPTAASRTWTVDTVAPDTTITAGPSGTTTANSDSFSFGASEAATFECALDGAAFAACSSPTSVGPLDEGSHTFRVRGIDAAGNPDPSPASRTWTIDSGAPETTITAGPPSPTNATSASFSFTSDEAGATFECSVDGVPFTPCTSPAMVGPLVDGSHTFAVRARGSSSVADPTPATRAWTVDTTTPDTTITAGPSGTTASTSASFSFTATEAGSSFACSLDGGSFAVCATPKVYTGLGGGAHTFNVRATDAAGNMDASPAARAWTIDADAPDTTITAAPPATTNSATATFSFTSSESGSTFECSLDGGTFTGCASPASTGSLSDGVHSFAVRAVDTVGNADASPATHTWVVDRTAADTIIDSGPAPVAGTGATFTFHATESGSTLRCSLDGAAFTVCTSPRSYTTLSDGTHSFRARAIDAAGNVDATPASWTWEADATAPLFTGITSAVADGDAGSITLAWSPASDERTPADQLVYDVCRATTPSACTSSFAVTVTTDAGVDSFRMSGLAPDTRFWFVVRARDAAGNRDANTDQRTARTLGSRATIAIAAGGKHMCALEGDGSLRCWGANGNGQLGDATTTARTTPDAPFDLPGSTQVVTGDAHTCALLTDGSVRCWGANANGQIGDGTTEDRLVPTEVSLPAPARALAAGRAHTCAVLSYGQVRCWGANGSGQLGDGTRVDAPVPVGTSGMGNVIAVAAGGNHTCALIADGATWCWGANANGQLGDGTRTLRPTAVRVASLPNATEIAAGYAHTCAIVTGGGMRCWGANANGQLGDSTYNERTSPVTVVGIARATHATAGSSHTCARLADGGARCWGHGGSGRLGNDATADRPTPTAVTGASNIATLTAGLAHTCALAGNGTVTCWGANDDGQLADGTTTSRRTPTPVTGLTGAAGVVALAAGQQHTCALATGGTVACWGANTIGQLGDGTTVSKTAAVPVPLGGSARAIAAGRAHTCVLLSSGGVRCWGANGSGQLGDGTTTNRTTSVGVLGLSDAVSISAGDTHTCALLANGAVRCWGANGNGQIGDGTTALRSTPVAVAGIATATGISAGAAHTCALLADGGARCWGANTDGQLGDGTTTSRTTPATVAGVSAVTRIVAGGYHACALLADGGARCWGANAYGQLGDGTTLQRENAAVVTGLSGARTISAGVVHTCVTLADGGARCWGWNGYGQLGDGTASDRSSPVSVVTISGATAIAGGEAHTCAALGDGTARCWGRNDDGRLGDGGTTTSATPVTVFAVP